MNSNIKQNVKGNDNFVVVNYDMHVSNISSILAEALPEIAKIVALQDDSVNDTKPYSVKDKIEYNNIKSFKEILQEYGQYGFKIDTLYEEYDNHTPGFIRSVFQYFRTKYLLKKEQLISLNENGEDPQLIIKRNSDNIIRDIFKQFVVEIKTVKNIEINMEALDTCALCVVCHALINCKILEKPPL
ncbi:ABC-three component system protein [Legionella spiritensis]|uniref:ABC-three component systems C-terminal domain-containing protein n=1 Tax=Legionella spiritensis TaxID=452 RepID=A0A0W0Z898_LEGSP|nr:ABC-three component system protein [Legionella spiritensis]KTD65344.1 hypothetical protein Lspi_0661 [Legionella spiritensis]SNV47383.1 Uncharacterised protein [Legionella spiritensis]